MKYKTTWTLLSSENVELSEHICLAVTSGKMLYLSPLQEVARPLQAMLCKWGTGHCKRGSETKTQKTDSEQREPAAIKPRSQRIFQLLHSWLSQVLCGCMTWDAHPSSANTVTASQGWMVTQKNGWHEGLLPIFSSQSKISHEAIRKKSSDFRKLACPKEHYSIY